jgi:hypothetical protein
MAAALLPDPLWNLVEPFLLTRIGPAWAGGGGSWSVHFAWLNQFRRLRVRYEKRADIHAAFLSLGCALICWQSLRKTWSAA